MFEKRKIGKTLQIYKPPQEFIKVPFETITYHYWVGNAQHIGKRKIQEDAFAFSDLGNQNLLMQNGICAVLSDGIGGLNNGHIVSNFVVKSVLTAFPQINLTNPISQQLQNIAQKINYDIMTQELSDCGATLLTAIIHQNKLFWCSIGDSRIYLFRNGYLHQLNEDHDYQNKLLSQYINSEYPLSLAFSDLQKDNLTSYIGIPNLKLIETTKRYFTLQNGDKIILCTDGVYQTLSKTELQTYLKAQPQDACENIIYGVMYKKLKTQDNSTVMIIEMNSEKRTNYE
ncbi:serine/threonine-protein phosphatase [Paludicola sp. MB14-C6]|uniref:PP2C family protein-serine/threonine phosphatase n=1 Tax=Paludihabitans sp. MB14-C6 TaxID=3070656 RepID=UPI0027DBF37B|nr:PP2C family serine/threonine-protein phosphatase [Paludicola sp. MB14-C6]WMJ22756.1 serine/threonine-protein phosphatase [Paludicola sp. MB14-C6]